jgi:hypothetical protein
MNAARRLRELPMASLIALGIALAAPLAGSWAGFGPPTNFAVDANPLAVALADLNGDGKLDAVTANYGGGSVSVLLGNGDGTFQPAQSFPAGAFASTVVVGDFNGDGKPDLAVGHFIASINPMRRAIRWMAPTPP